MCHSVLVCMILPWFLNYWKISLWTFSLRLEHPLVSRSSGWEQRGASRAGWKEGCVGSDEMEHPQVNPWKQVSLDYSKLSFKLLGTKAQYRSVQKGRCPLVLKFCVCPEFLFFREGCWIQRRESKSLNLAVFTRAQTLNTFSRVGNAKVVCFYGISQ